MIKRIHQVALLLLLSLWALPLAAQEEGISELTDTTSLFRFVPSKDLFFVPFGDNQKELDRLCNVLRANMEHLRAGRMYVCVSSYAASAGNGLSASRMAYLRTNRVKSELIQRAGITEKMFVTDRRISTPYSDSLRNVVVVTFPASVEKIAQIAGPQAAETVRTYYREIETRKQEAQAAQEEVVLQQQREKAAQEAALQREADAARQRALQEEAQRHADAERRRLEAEEQARLAAEAANAIPHTLALRANLLRWASLTPDVGVEWRISRDWSVALDATWTAWSWKEGTRRYGLWEISPAVHYSLGTQKRGYVGVMYHIGQFNYKLSDTGKQGDLQGGGLVGGYRLPIGKRLSLDFNLGVGCTHAQFDSYIQVGDVKVRTESLRRNYWGINKAGVTLVWKLL